MDDSETSELTASVGALITTDRVNKISSYKQWVVCMVGQLAVGLCVSHTCFIVDSL